MMHTWDSLPLQYQSQNHKFMAQYPDSTLVTLPSNVAIQEVKQRVWFSSILIKLHMNIAHAAGQLDKLSLVTSYNCLMIYSSLVAENRPLQTRF